MKDFLQNYNRLDTRAKTLLSVVCKECGFDIAAALCLHLFGHKEGTDDGFWCTISTTHRDRIFEIAKAQGLIQVGAFNLTVPA